MEQKINHLAVLLSVILQQFIGFLWYGSFDQQWLQAIGKTRDQINPSDFTPYIIAVIAAFAVAYVMAWVFRQQRVRFIGDGIKVAFLLFLGFNVLVMATHYAFAGMPWDLFWIDGGHAGINFIVTGIVLAVWKKKPKKSS